ncbi:RHS repeat-associated core domain-containing protein [Orenia marismortui]|uniref:RHS repeat-associated protein n=1 Tax=Orenia marismortui TaxID=46469 RepID=A0A4R8H8I0_9FIRM|nr:RHS repeat-associated core domain-containing protein [Orenia marismortui]TDX51137.1 RHS repeat-associated protein [Orenia marismortui]
MGNGIDEVLGVYGEQTQYLYSNHLGSITGITGTDGSVVGTQSYTPYGMIRNTTGTFNTSLGFIGRSQSAVTGLTYIRARYYDASVGRFTRVDPIRDGLNWYAYPTNPISYYDPYGLFWGRIVEIGAGGLQVLGGLGQVTLGGSIVAGSGIGTVFSGGTLTIPMAATAAGGGYISFHGGSNMAEGFGKIFGIEDPSDLNLARQMWGDGCNQEGFDGDDLYNLIDLGISGYGLTKTGPGLINKITSGKVTETVVNGRTHRVFYNYNFDVLITTGHGRNALNDIRGMIWTGVQYSTDDNEE